MRPALLSRSDLERLPTFGVELPVLLLLVGVTALSIAGIIVFVMFGSKVAGTVERFTFPRGVPLSNAGFSKFSDDLLMAA
jgi:formate hydrogenlyase subunit 3/multisubunit Na+/H+ antiporter MnhD subunit